jgi:hypothetical protein
MNYRWDENKETKKMIYDGIKRCYGDKNKISTNPQGIANIIYSFGEMKFKWADILPMDITIKEGAENKIIAFIEIDGPDHFVTREDGQRVSHRRDQLREELYKFNHPGVPLLRIDQRPYERYVEELYEKLVTMKS